MAPQIPLSLAMIVRDEEQLLGRVLSDAAQICDELVVVDTGSVDRSKEVAKAFGAKVFEFEWNDDWCAARDASFAHCSNEWVLWLDADDRIPPLAIVGFSQLKQFLAEHPQLGAVRMRYHYTYSDTDPNRCLFSSENIRMVRRTPEVHWVGSPHPDLSVAPAPVVERPEALWTTAAWVEHRTTAQRRVKSSDRKLRQLEAAVATDARRPLAYFFLADELRGRGQYKEAMRTYEQGLALCDEWALAEPFNRDITVSSIWPRYEVLVQMANCADAMGDTEKKLDLLERALQLDSSRAGALIDLGLHHYHRKQWPQAAAFFAGATTLVPPTEGLVSWDLYSWLPWDCLSVCHAEMGMFEEALSETVQALRTSPERERLFANLSVCLDRLQG